MDLENKKEEEQEKTGLMSRREFIKAAGATAATVMVASVAKSPVYAVAPGRVIGANDCIGVGFVGVGGMGGNHVDVLKGISAEANAVHVAVCDLWEKRKQEAREAAGVPESKVYHDYRKLLEDKDVDAVIVATPEHWHAPVTIHALEAGKHVYCEKPMTRHLEEAFKVHDTVKKTGKVLQVGSQGCTAAIWSKANELIQAGKIGHLVWAQGSYCRNSKEGEWNYEIDPDANESNLDWKLWLGSCPKRPWDPARYFRFRKYSDYSAGILSDLFPHRLHPLVKAIGPEYPKRVTCLGTMEIHKDREVADTTHIMVEFPGGYTMFIAGSTANEQGLQDMIRGHKATLYFGGDKIQLNPERPYADEIEAQAVDVQGPSESVEEHQKNFYSCIRTGAKPNCDVELATKVQTIVSLAEMSYRQGKTMGFDPEKRKVL